MDKYMNEYKAAVESVSAERDIVSAAKARIGRKEHTLIASGAPPPLSALC